MEGERGDTGGLKQPLGLLNVSAGDQSPVGDKQRPAEAELSRQLAESPELTIPEYDPRVVLEIKGKHRSGVRSREPEVGRQEAGVRMKGGVGAKRLRFY